LTAPWPQETSTAFLTVSSARFFWLTVDSRDLIQKIPCLLFPRHLNNHFGVTRLQAVEHGADVVETDIHLTSDGHLICCHDVSPRRTTNYEGPEDATWANLTLAEVKALDAGCRFDKASTEEPIRIPELREAFQLLLDHPNVWLNVDMKAHVPQTAEKLHSMIGEFDLRQRVIVCSMNEKMLQQYRQLDPEAPTGASPKEVVQFYTMHKIGLARFHGRKADIYHLPTPKLVKKFSGWGIGTNLDTTDFIERAHALGQKVAYWSINDPEDIRTLLRAGADGVMTDCVDVAFKVFQEEGFR